MINTVLRYYGVLLQKPMLQWNVLDMMALLILFLFALGVLTIIGQIVSLALEYIDDLVYQYRHRKLSRVKKAENKWEEGRKGKGF